MNPKGIRACLPGTIPDDGAEPLELGVGQRAKGRRLLILGLRSGEGVVKGRGAEGCGHDEEEEGGGELQLEGEHCKSSINNFIVRAAWFQSK